MALDQKKYENSLDMVLRDTRPFATRVADSMSKPGTSAATFMIMGASFYVTEYAIYWGDVIFLLGLLYFWFLNTRDRSLAFKLPMTAKFKDTNNTGPGKNMKPEGILYLGNVDKTNEEVWFTNSDIRTHVLYLGTTGSGKTEGLKSMVSNALCWGSGFVYVDGKADTDLWSSLSSLVRRFGRDDDLLVLNYMTGNSDVKAPSNTMNPFSSGSASYLTQMIVSLMPEASGDNVMWKERAVSLVASIMPALTWKRDNQDMPMNIGSIRKYLILNSIIALSRDTSLPEKIRDGVKGYLDTLPGYVDDAFDDNGEVKPPGPNQPQVNTEVPFQQHGYLSMQLTRALQSLGDEYGYIFDAAAADVDMLDVVLNRRILVVLIPALEKSSDEIANLGKIVSAALKGMMGTTLGTTVEGESATVIENKPTQSATPFMTVFDEVGYYTAEGMAVMAAQARSLGFSLIYAAQDLPALEKRVREEARSITANCNVKLFGKLEDPTQTKEFFENTVGQAIVTEVQGFQTTGGLSKSYTDTQSAGMQMRPRATYDGLKKFKEGQAVCTFGESVVDIRVFYSNPGFAKAMRVTRYIGLNPINESITKHTAQITKLRDRMVKRGWTAQKEDVDAETPDELTAIAKCLKSARKKGKDAVESAILGVLSVHALSNDLPETQSAGTASVGSGGSGGGPAAARKPVAGQQQTAPPISAKPPETKSGNTAPPPPPKPPEKTPEPEKTGAGAGDAGGDDNPMSFFGAPKKHNESANTQQPGQPEPVKKAQSTTQAQTTAQTTSSAGQPATATTDSSASDDDNPMSFFGSGGNKASSPPPAPDTAKPKQDPPGEQTTTKPAEQPVSMSEKSSSTAETHQESADSSAQQSSPTSWKEVMGQTEARDAAERLDPETAKIIKGAAQDMRGKIFKDSKKSDVTEAAE